MCQACYIHISCHCNKQDPFKLPILQMRKSSRKAITCPRSQSFLVRHRSIFLHRNGCIPSGPYFTCYCGHVSLLCLYYPANFPQLCSLTSTGFLVQGQVHCSNTLTGECIIPDKLTPKKGSSWTNSYANFNELHLFLCLIALFHLVFLEFQMLPEIHCLNLMTSLVVRLVTPEDVFLKPSWLKLNTPWSSHVNPISLCPNDKAEGLLLPAYTLSFSFSLPQ